jgi:hypothetical protein
MQSSARELSIVSPSPTLKHRTMGLRVQHALETAVDVDALEVAVDVAAFVVVRYVPGDARVAEEVDFSAGLFGRAGDGGHISDGGGGEGEEEIEEEEKELYSCLLCWVCWRRGVYRA